MRAVLASVINYGIPDLAGPCLRNWARRDPELDDVAIDLVELTTETAPEAAARRILADRPALVGITCFVWNAPLVYDIVRRIELLSPETAVVLGGAEVATTGERVLNRNPGVDFVALGEGEETFRLLLRALAGRGVALAQVPGLARRENGAVVKTAPAPLIDLAAAPEVYTGLAGTPGATKLPVMLEGSRGCPFLCSFCDWGPRQMRYVPLERLEREFRALVDRFKLVILCDADLLMDRRRGVAVMKMFRRAAEGKDVVLKFDTNPLFLCEEVDEILAGDPELFQLSFGLQSVNPETHKRIQRPFDLERMEKNLLRLKKAAPGARFWFTTIFGLPGDGYASFRATVDWILRWRPQAFCSSQLMMLPGAEITHEGHDPRVEFQTEPPYQVYQTDAMSRSDMARAREMAYYSEVLFQFRVMGRQAAADILFGGEFDALTMKPGSRVAHLEAWIEHLKASDFDVAYGKPVADVDEIVQRRYIFDAVARMGNDKLDAAAFLHATRRFVESRSRVAA